MNSLQDTPLDMWEVSRRLGKRSKTYSDFRHIWSCKPMIDDGQIMHIIKMGFELSYVGK